MHVLYFNLRMDADDPVLGFAGRWVDAIAERVDRVTVVTMAAGRVVVPENVRVVSVGKEKGLSEPARVIQFYRWCSRILRTDPPDVIFSHMIPAFSILFAPLARWSGTPSVLWYTHGATPRDLRLAERLVDRCITSTSEGFRLKSRRLEVLQHGIDVKALKPAEGHDANWRRTAVVVGRIAPVKRVLECVEGVARARAKGLDLRLEIFGAPSTEADERYETRLRSLIDSPELGGSAVLRGPLPYAEIGAAFHTGAIFLSMSRTGSMDKAILEAMASGCIPISDNDAFATIARDRGWNHLVPDQGVDGLVRCLRGVLEMPEAERVRLADELREFVVREHSLDALADRIVGCLRSLTGVVPSDHATPAGPAS